MAGLKLTQETKGWLKTTIRKLQYDFDLASLSFLELLDHLEEFKVDRAEIRAFLKKHDHKFCHSDFKLLLDCETVLSDSIEVSPVFSRYFTLLVQLILERKLNQQEQEATKKYNNLCQKLKYSEIDLTEENTLDDSGFTADNYIFIQ